MGAVAAIEDNPVEADLLGAVCESWLLDRPYNRDASCSRPAGCGRGTTPSAASASCDCSPERPGPAVASPSVPHVAVTAFGADRPGIVAAVTKVFVEQGCNLEDTSMTILRGHFAMMLVVDAPAGFTPGELERALAGPAARARPRRRRARPRRRACRSRRGGDAWTVSVYGVDRPGIVHRVSRLLADEREHRRPHDPGDRRPGAPAYAMLLEVTVPPGLDVAELARPVDASWPASWASSAACTRPTPTSCDRGLTGGGPARPPAAGARAEPARDADRADRRRGAIALAVDLVDTMRASPACVGLAAPQIGVPLRAFVVDVTGHRKARSCHGRGRAVRPRGRRRRRPVVAREGCMSVPDLTGDVPRADRVVVRGLTPEGAHRVLEVDAFEARPCCTSSTISTALLFLDRVASPASMFRRKVYRSAGERRTLTPCRSRGSC